MVLAVGWGHAWWHLDRIERRDERLRAENRRLGDLVAHVCWERDQAMRQAATAQDEMMALALHRHLALFDHEMRTN